MNSLNNITPLIVTVAMIGIIPLLAVVVTSFTKISVVLLIVRNALGIQQTPPNIIIYTIAIVLTLNIMAPVFNEMIAAAGTVNFAIASIADAGNAFSIISKPLKVFLGLYASESSRMIFESTKVAVPTAPTAPAIPAMIDPELTVLIPAFLLDELTKAFEIGVRLYIPFIAIDFIVSAILISLGMQMLSPPLISTPIKILLFTLVDGWSKLFYGLIQTYSTAS
jgi:type III secretion protein R